MKKILIGISILISYFGYRAYESNNYNGTIGEVNITESVSEEEIDVYISFSGCVTSDKVIKTQYGETIESVVNRNIDLLKEHYSVISYNEIKDDIITKEQVIEIECKSRINVLGCIKEVEIYFEEGDRLVDYEHLLMLGNTCSMNEYEEIKNDYLKEGKNIFLERKLEVYLEGCIEEVIYIESHTNLFTVLEEMGLDYKCDMIQIKEETNEFVKSDSVYYLPIKDSFVVESNFETFEVYYSKGEYLREYKDYIEKKVTCDFNFILGYDVLIEKDRTYYANCMINVILKGDLTNMCSELRVNMGTQIGSPDVYNVLRFCYKSGVDLSVLDKEQILYDGYVIELYL